MRLTERAAIAMMLAAVSSAAQAESRQPIDLPAGRLGPAIVMLGRQAGISIGVSDPSLAAIPVRKVRGKMSVRQALDQLLKATNASFINVGSHGWRIVRRQVQAPAPQKTVSWNPETQDEPESAALVVTGSKRAMPLSDYPGSVSILHMDDFPPDSEGRGSDVIAARLPGVTSTHLGTGRNKLFMRGIADSSFNGPTQATVGQYLGETRLNYNAPDPDLRLYDIATIEVLQGPQGTLHGAGSLGGVLRIMPVAPKLGVTQSSIALSAGSTAHGGPSYDANAMINLPVLGDQVAVRALGYIVRDGGYIDDSLRKLKDVNRSDTYGGRIALRAEPAPGWTIDLGGAIQTIRGDDGQFAERGLPDLTKASPVAQVFANDYGLGQLVIRKDWDSGLSFVSATGVVRQEISETYDATGPTDVPALFRQKSRISLISNENRLSHDMSGGIGWVIGTSLIRNRYRLNRVAGEVLFTRAVTGVENGVDEATLFGEATVRIMPQVNLTGGGRLTYARLSGEALDAPLPIAMDAALLQARRGATNLLPSVALTYTPADDLTLFARYQEGFRPGGIVVRNNNVQRYRNDDVASMEVGLRYNDYSETGFDAAISVVHTRWQNIQADLVDIFGLPATTNIGDGRIWSVDAALGWRPLPGLRIEASGVFADSKLTRADSTIVVLRADLPIGSDFVSIGPDVVIVEHDSLPNVARLNGRIGAEYAATLAGDYNLNLSAWARYVGKSRLGIGPVLDVAQGDFLDTAFSARIGRGGYGLFFSATNLFDTIGNRFALGSPFTLSFENQITPLRPRTIRVGMDVRF